MVADIAGELGKEEPERISRTIKNITKSIEANYQETIVKKNYISYALDVADKILVFEIRSECVAIYLREDFWCDSMSGMGIGFEK